jgi:hypothetical protein
MDEKFNERLVEQTNMLANTRAIVGICAILKRRGHVTEAELEGLRHQHLRAFDDMLEAIPPGRGTAEALSVRHRQIEALWDKLLPGHPTTPD